MSLETILIIVLVDSCLAVAAGTMGGVSARSGQ
jgi:hypothetical protein